MEKCYAHMLGGCSDKLSREHIISKGILDDSVGVIGFSWCKDQMARVSKNSLVSKILCVTHNNLLSPFDSEIKAHKEYIELVDNNDKVFDRNPEMIKRGAFQYRNSGLSMERWFLKTLINLCKVNQKEAKIDVELLLPYLYGDKKFEYPYGLGSLTKPGLSVNTSDVIQVSPLLTPGKTGVVVGGGIFRYRGFAHLLLIPPCKFTIEREKPIIDPVFFGEFKDLIGCQYNWHNENILYSRKKPSGLVVNAQSITFAWD